MAPGRLVALGILAASLCGCPRPRRVSGTVYARGTTSPSGARALGTPLAGATATWSCPPSVQGPAPQTLTTDASGAFASKDFYVDMPGACEVLVTKAGHLELHERFDRLSSDGSPHVAVELPAVTP